MMNWLKKFKEPHVIYQIKSDLSDMSQEELWAHVKELTRSPHWRYLEEILHRDREMKVVELVHATDEGAHNRVRGKIKLLDWLLSFSKILV